MSIYSRYAWITPQGRHLLNEAAGEINTTLEKLKFDILTEAVTEGKTDNIVAGEVKPLEQFQEFLSGTLNKAINDGPVDSQGNRGISDREYDKLRSEWAGIESLVENNNLRAVRLDDGSRFGEMYGGLKTKMESFFNRVSRDLGYGQAYHTSLPPDTKPSVLYRYDPETSTKEHGLASARLEALDEFSRQNPELAQTHKYAISKYRKWNREVVDILDPGEENLVPEKRINHVQKLMKEGYKAATSIKLESGANLFETLEKKAGEIMQKAGKELNKTGGEKNGLSGEFEKTKDPEQSQPVQEGTTPAGNIPVGPRADLC
jgi:hypothetical protein